MDWIAGLPTTAGGFDRQLALFTLTNQQRQAFCFMEMGGFDMIQNHVDLLSGKLHMLFPHARRRRRPTPPPLSTLTRISAIQTLPNPAYAMKQSFWCILRLPPEWFGSGEAFQAKPQTPGLRGHNDSWAMSTLYIRDIYCIESPGGAL